MCKWTKVKNYREVPVGVWLAELEKEHFDSVIHTISVHPNLIIVGGGFGFDMPTVIAYRPLPELSVKESVLLG